MKLLKIKSKTPDPFIEDEVVAHEVILEVKKEKNSVNSWRIRILHPNKEYLVEELEKFLEEQDDFTREAYDEILQKKNLSKVESFEFPEEILLKFDTKEKIFKEDQDLCHKVLATQIVKSDDINEVMEIARNLKDKHKNIETHHEPILYKAFYKKGRKRMRSSPTKFQDEN